MRPRVRSACQWTVVCALGGHVVLGIGQEVPAPAAVAPDPDVAARAKAWRAKALEYASRVADQEMRNHVYLEAAHVLARAGDLVEAKKAAEQIANPQTRVYAHSAVAKRYMERGNAAAALRTLADCERSFAGADVNDRQSGFNYLVDAYAACGFVKEAAAAGTQTRWPQFTPDDLARKAVERGDVINGLNQAVGQKLSLAAHVIEWDKNPEHVAHALTTARGVGSDKKFDHGFANVSRALVKTNRLAEAAEMASRITEPLQQARARGEIAAAEAADETIEAVRARIEAAELVEEKQPLYQLLITKLIEADQLGDAELAVADLDAVVRASLRPDEASKFGTVTASGRSAMVKTLHASIAAAYFKKGSHDDYERQMRLAVDAVAEMEGRSGIAKVFALMQVLSVQLGAEDLAGARETIKKVKQAADAEPEGRGLSDFTVSTMAGKVAEGLINKGQIAEGIEVAADIHGSTVGLAISGVAKALIRADRIDDAKAQMKRLIVEGDAAVAAMAAEDKDDDLRYRRRATDGDRVSAFKDVGAAMRAAERDAELEIWLAEMPDDAMRAAACLGASEPRAD
jgi:tetratricopeptide (TPR) repeat protein